MGIALKILAILAVLAGVHFAWGLDAIFEALKKKGISIRNMNGYLRISAGSRAENQELIQALDKLLQ